MALEFASGNQKDETVRDEEKAYDMAEAELEARELKAMYKEYMDDPAAFVRDEAARVEAKRKEGIITQTFAKDFVSLAQAGLHPDDFDAWANWASDRAGNMHDYMKSLSNKSEFELRVDTVKFRIAEMMNRKTLEWWDRKTKGTPLETSIASEKFYASYVLRMTNPAENTAPNTIAVIEAELDDFVEKREAAAAELQKRKGIIKEAA